LRYGLGGRHGWVDELPQQLATLPQGGGFALIGQQAVMAYADKPWRENREQKTLDKGMRRYGQGLELIALVAVAGGKADLPIADIDEAMIGDGHAMRGASEILNDVLRALEGALGVDDPVVRIEGIEPLGEARLGMQRGRRLIEAQGLRKRGLLAGFQTRAPEDLPPGLDRAEQLRVGWSPARLILGERPAGHERVEMDVGLEPLIPGMEDQGGAELAAHVLPTTLAQRGTGGTTEQAKQEPFVTKNQGIESVGEGKHRVQGGGRQEFRPPGYHPVSLRDGLTRGTVPVTTRGVRIAFEAALWTLLGVAPKVSRTTGHDRCHDCGLGCRDGLRVPIALAVEATGSPGPCARKSTP
jgi:hypothetical protein